MSQILPQDDDMASGGIFGSKEVDVFVVGRSDHHFSLTDVDKACNVKDGLE